MVRGVHRSHKTTAAPKKLKSAKSAASREAAHVSKAIHGWIAPTTTSGISLKNRVKLVKLDKLGKKTKHAFDVTFKQKA